MLTIEFWKAPEEFLGRDKMLCQPCPKLFFSQASDNYLLYK